jgi:PAS domain S-box-containing protein
MAVANPESSLQSAGDSISTNRIVAAQEVALLFNQANVSILSAWVAGLLIAAVLWSAVEHSKIYIWISLLSVVTVARLALAYSFRHADAGHDKYTRWRDRAVMSSGLLGIMWGLAGTMLFTPTSVPHQMFLGFMLAGALASAMPFMASVWPAYVALLIPTSLPYALRLLEEGTPMAKTMALIVVLFAIIMIYASRKMNLTVSESLRLRYDKQVLADILGQTADELDLANAVREQAKRVARESERRVQILADAPFEGIFIHENGTILDANKTLLGILGLNLEDVIGRKVIDFVSTDSRSRVAQELDQPTGEVFITTARKHTGEILKLEVRGRHFPFQGRTVRVVSLRPVS